METEKKTLKWDLHKKHLNDLIVSQLGNENFPTIKIIFEDQSYMICSKLVLCLSSPLVRNILSSPGRCEHHEDIIIMPMAVKEDIEQVLQLMTSGEQIVSVLYSFCLFLETPTSIISLKIIVDNF